MMYKGSNHPLVVWATCFLWLTSMLFIVWSLILFFCVGDIIMLTGTDLVNAFVLLSGIIMLPTNFNMLCAIANGRKIDPKARVLCCPLWLCIWWIIIINVVAAAICAEKILICAEITSKHIKTSMRNYRSVPKYKHFVDNLQWSMKCCGFNSYKDWFSQDWYDKIRDYEWDPSMDKRSVSNKKTALVTDSVPLSCCKSGSCISNYISELGTYSINTNGCGPLMNRIIIISMYAHLAIFLIVVILEIMILKLIKKNEKQSKPKTKRKFNVRHIMTVKDNFVASSGSRLLNPEDSDDIEASFNVEEK